MNSKRNSTVEVGIAGALMQGALATLQMAQPPGKEQSRPSLGQHGQAGAEGVSTGEVSDCRALLVPRSRVGLVCFSHWAQQAAGCFSV
ncbi:MAG: hypothetical protein L0Z53_01185 [Acidobacteriales bacterium]|nr:hypothetical protein [Terriglobales bacterium]